MSSPSVAKAIFEACLLLRQLVKLIVAAIATGDVRDLIEICEIAPSFALKARRHLYQALNESEAA